MGIAVIHLHNETRQVVVLVKGLLQFLSDVCKLEVEEILMRGLQIMQKSGNRDAVIIVHYLIAIDREIHYQQKSKGVNPLVVTNFADGLITESKVNTETTQTLQEIIIVGNKTNHLIVGLVHLLILHTSFPSIPY